MAFHTVLVYRLDINVNHYRLLYVKLVQLSCSFHFSMCTGYQLECSDNCEDVVCAAPQMSQEEVLETVPSGNDECERLMCPKPYYKSFDCINVKSSSQLCFCPQGYKQTQVTLFPTFSI